MLLRAQKLLGSIKRTYGPHASLLPINSLSSNLPPSPFLHPIYSAHPPSDILASLFSKPSPNSPEEAAVLGSRMTDVDVASVKGFLREMTVQSLLPFMERCVTNWNELVTPSPWSSTQTWAERQRFYSSNRAGAVSQVVSSVLVASSSAPQDPRARVRLRRTTRQATTSLVACASEALSEPASAKC